MEQSLQQDEVKKPLEIWQGIVGLFTIAAIVIGLYSSQVGEAKAASAKQENHELRIKQLENDRIEMKADIRETKAIVTDIRVILQDKQDRTK